MLLKERIQNTSHLSDSQHAVLTYMYENPHEIETMTLKEIAKASYTSPATLIRLSKNLGYDGFDELRRDFLKEEEYLNRNFQSIDANIPFHANDNYIGIASKLTALMKETADDTLSLIEFQDLKKAVTILLSAEKIHLTAISFPLLYGHIFQIRMQRIGKLVEITDLLGEQLFAEPIISSHDCALLISYSGETPLIRQMVELYKRKGIPMVAITGLGNSTLRRNATVSLSVTTREKLYSKISGFCNSASIQLILDILYSCIFKENYEVNLHNQKALSKRSEPGRFATYDIMKE